MSALEIRTQLFILGGNMHWFFLNILYKKHLITQG